MPTRIFSFPETIAPIKLFKTIISLVERYTIDYFSFKKFSSSSQGSLICAEQKGVKDMDVITPHQCVLLPQALNSSSSLHRKYFLFFLLTFHEHHPSLLSCGLFPFPWQKFTNLEAVLVRTHAIWDHISLMPHRLNCRQVHYPQNWSTCILLFGEEKLRSWDHILCSCIQREQRDFSTAAICNFHTQSSKLVIFVVFYCISVIVSVLWVQ